MGVSTGLLLNLGLVGSGVRPYRLIVGGDDILNGTTAGPGGVPFDSIEWEYTSDAQPAQMRFDHWDLNRAFTMPGHAEVRLWDEVNDLDLFWGYLIARETRPIAPSGRVVSMRAIDASMLLDRNVVTRRKFEAGKTDQHIIMTLISQYYIGPALTVSGTYIRETNTNMPEMKFELTTLRSAIDQVCKAADSDGLGERFLYVDPQKRVQYWRAPFTDPAPFDITDGVPGAGEKNVSDLELVYDDSDIVTAVYVQGSTKLGSGWSWSTYGVVTYGWRAEFLDVPDSDTAAKLQAYGQAYLRGKDRPVRRGKFSITGTDGWKADQTVQITSTALGLTSEAFDIKHVTVSVLSGEPVFNHVVEFGARKPGKIRDRVGTRVKGSGDTIGSVIVVR
jgi:hypothetical protein